MYKRQIFEEEFRGDELEWDLATETQRISVLFDDIPWPRERLEGIVATISRLEEAAGIDHLIGLCVRQMAGPDVSCER